MTHEAAAASYCRGLGIDSAGGVAGASGGGVAQKPLWFEISYLGKPIWESDS